MSERQFFAVMMLLLSIADFQTGSRVGAAVFGLAGAVAAFIEFASWIVRSWRADKEGA